MFYQKNRVSIKIYDIGSRSAGDFISEEPDLHANIKQWSLICMKCYTKKKKISMVLYNTESCSAGDLIREEPGQHGIILYWILSAEDGLLDRYHAIKHFLLISRRRYTRNKTDQQETLYHRNRIGMKSYNTRA